MAEAFITRRGGGAAVEVIEFIAGDYSESISLAALKGKKRFIISLQEGCGLTNNFNFVSLYYNDGYAYLSYVHEDNMAMKFVEGTTDVVTFDSTTGKVTFTWNVITGVCTRPYKHRCWIFE